MGAVRLGRDGEGQEAGDIDLPERLHFRGLLTALALKPVHVLGGCSHHLLCLQLTLVLGTIHL